MVVGRGINRAGLPGECDHHRGILPGICLVLRCPMRVSTAPFIFLGLVIFVLLPPAVSSAETLAIVGSTVVDVSDFGHGTADVVDAVVVIEGDAIVAVGPQTEVEIPPGARILDAHGRFMVPGLTDGFAALNNQAYADAAGMVLALSRRIRGPVPTGSCSQ